MNKLNLQSFNVTILQIQDFWNKVKEFFKDKKATTYLMIENYCEDIEIKLDPGLYFEKGNFPEKWPEPSYLWPSGFIFNENSELSWRYDLDDFIFRLVHSDESASLAFSDNKNHIIEYEKKESAEYLCWGNYDNRLDKWFEKQVPRPVRYPVDDKKAYCVVVSNEYFNGDKKLVLTCFSSVESYDIIPDRLSKTSGDVISPVEEKDIMKERGE
jgi:hypothetical protein